jgi:hypothetical protein
MAQAGERDTHARQQVGRAVTILHVGWMDNHPNPPADGVGEDLPLTALDHLFGRIAARATGLGRLDRLAVDHTSGRTGFPARGLAHVHQQHMIDGVYGGNPWAAGAIGSRLGL